MGNEGYIALIGYPARDTKTFPDGHVEESLGGVLFSALALAALARPLGLNVVPVCRVGRDIADEALRLLAAGGCRLDGIYVADAPTQRSFITITEPDERHERVEGGLPPLRFDEIAPWLDARAIAVNFVTATELDLATFRRLRDEYRGPIVADYHTLALATLPDGRRVPFRRADWAAWLEVPTVVQMNEGEAETIAGIRLADAGMCAIFARQMMFLGPRAATITRAAEGAVGAEHRERAFATYDIPGFVPEQIIDTVGCGDVFLAALTAGWCRFGSLDPSLLLATRAAGLHAGYRGLDGLAGVVAAWDAMPAPVPA